MRRRETNGAGGSTVERRRRYRSGLASELVAAVFLLCRGYRILARRFRVPAGEIDLIAKRGRLVAFVEVKRRRDAATAESAVTPRQRLRIQRAADMWIARNRRYAEHELRFDVIFILPRRWPRHIEGGL